MEDRDHSVFNQKAMKVMKKLDGYIIKMYLKTFFFTALLFSLIAVVIDFSDRLDKFIENQVPASEVVTLYYLHWIAFINGMLWPLFALIGVIFFTSRLAKNSEIISIFNAGIPFRRLMLPYLFAAGSVSIVHFVANNYLIPMGSKIRIPFENENIWNNTDFSRTRDIHIMLDPQTKLYIRNYQQRDSSALDMRLEKYDAQAELVSFMEAKRAKYDAKEKKWSLRNFMMRSFNDLEESLQLGQGETLDTAINITPEDLTRIKNQQQIMTSPELRQYLRKQQARGIGGTRIFETELYRRSSEPVSILILTVIGMAVASRKVRGGLGIHLAIGISIGALYILLTKFTMTFTNSESLGPIMGVWLPNIIFGLVAVYLTRIAQK